jgi:hypothetical protein
MADIRIVCKTHGENEVITDVGLEDGSKHTVLEIWNRITNMEDTFYTMENNNRAEVHARQRRDTGTKYLTTDPDDENVNNLDFLPSCAP